MEKTIAVLSGDWIWPEIMVEALRVLDAIEEKYGHKFNRVEALVWWAAYDEHGEHFPEASKKVCDESDAILFAAVWWPVDQLDKPKWNNCEANSLLTIRKTYSFNANFRPVKVYPELKNICPLKERVIAGWIDILFIRELIGDIYFWEKKRFVRDGQRVATDVAEYTEEQVRNIAHTAFQAAGKRRKKVTSVDKANVLTVSKLWREVVLEVAKEYPEIELEHMLVDNCAMQLIRNPSQFDVIVTGNMFGDILSDAGAVLPGSLWMLPSASLNSEGFWFYEPSWWSAPDIAWKWIANPIAQILSVSMMLRFAFDLQAEADAIENAVNATLKWGFRTGDIYEEWNTKVGTKEMTDEIIKNLK